MQHRQMESEWEKKKNTNGKFGVKVRMMLILC